MSVTDQPLFRVKMDLDLTFEIYTNPDNLKMMFKAISAMVIWDLFQNKNVKSIACQSFSSLIHKKLIKGGCVLKRTNSLYWSRGQIIIKVLSFNPLFYDCDILKLESFDFTLQLPNISKGRQYFSYNGVFKMEKYHPKYINYLLEDGYQVLDQSNIDLKCKIFYKHYNNTSMDRTDSEKFKQSILLNVLHIKKKKLEKDLSKWVPSNQPLTPSAPHMEKLKFNSNSLSDVRSIGSRKSLKSLWSISKLKGLIKEI